MEIDRTMENKTVLCAFVLSHAGNKTIPCVVCFSHTSGASEPDERTYLTRIFAQPNVISTFNNMNE